jgi:hypothetical protein
MTRWLVVLAVVLAVAAPAQAAPAWRALDASHTTYLVDRDPTKPVLEVDAAGHALVSYTVDGKPRHLLVWGAVNALPPTRGRTQVAFQVDYSGGWKSLAKPSYDKTIKNVCGRYDGPALAWYVEGAGCKAPDGSYWALQLWQRMLPNLGFKPWLPEQSVWELHVSHWKGPLAELRVSQDWAWGGQYQQLVGQYLYDGKPVFGFASTPTGAPTDTWGRNMYLDTFGSLYGPGWARENSFLAQMTNGRFCYSLGPRPPYAGYPASGPRMGRGQKYRITALGPGVTPAVMWEGADIGDWNANDPAKAQAEQQTNELVQQLGFTPSQCHV